MLDGFWFWWSIGDRAHSLRESAALRPAVAVLGLRRPTLAFPFVYALALLVPGIGSAAPWLLGVLLFVAGMSSSLVLCGIGGGFAGYPRRHAITATCLASTIGAFIAVFVHSIAWMAAVAVSALLMPASVILFRKANLVPKPENIQNRRRAFDVMRQYRSLLVFMFLYSALFGIVVVQGASMQPEDTGSLSMLVAICVPGVALLVLLTGTKVRIDVESLRRLLLALAIVGMAPLAFLPAHIGFYFLLLLTVAFGIFDIANFVTLFEIIRENDLPKLEAFAIGRLLSELGIAVGWGFALAVTAVAGDAASTVLLVAEATTVALIVLGLALLGRDFPASEIASDLQQPKDESLPLEPHDPYAYRARAVRAIEGEFELSPREREVFELLATGRSPKRISEKLFVSESTAKSHCYRIYQKLGIHSQQDLLDVIDERIAAERDSQWVVMP